MIKDDETFYVCRDCLELVPFDSNDDDYIPFTDYCDKCALRRMRQDRIRRYRFRRRERAIVLRNRLELELILDGDIPF